MKGKRTVTMEKSEIPKKETSPYAFSEKMYVLQCALAYFISIITTGAYLAKLTTTIGISDGMTAILSNIASLACLFQLLSIPISHKKTFKRSVITTVFIAQVLLGFLYLIPFFGFSSGVNSALFFICIFFSYIFTQISGPLKFTWFMSLPSPERKGSFQSVVQMFSHATGLAFSFTASFLLDYFTETGNTEAMFITFTTVIMVLSVLNFITLSVSKEKPRPPMPKASVFGDVKSVLKQKGFPIYVLMYTLYCTGINMTSAFLGTYQVKELGLSMVQISTISAINAVSAIAFLAFFGNFARRRGLIKSICTGFPIYALGYLFITFTNPSNGFVMLILYNVICTFGSAGIVVGIEPILFDTIPEEYRTTALSVKNFVAGIASFLTTLAATLLLNHIQSSGNKIFGINMYAQQLFAIITCALLLTSMMLFRAYAKKSQNQGQD